MLCNIYLTKEMLSSFAKHRKCAISLENKGHHKHKYVKGLMSNVICMLLHLNWKPLFWNEWHDSRGNQYKLYDTKKVAISVAPALVDSYIAISLHRADAHYEGQGVAQGVDWNTSLIYHRHLENKAKHIPLSVHLNAFCVQELGPKLELQLISPNTMQFVKGAAMLMTMHCIVFGRVKQITISKLRQFKKHKN
jgi:hypothetical protein